MPVRLAAEPEELGQCSGRCGATATFRPAVCRGAVIHKRVRQRAAATGYDPAPVEQPGGQSLRTGSVTPTFRDRADAHAANRTRVGQTVSIARSL